MPDLLPVRLWLTMFEVGPCPARLLLRKLLKALGIRD